MTQFQQVEKVGVGNVTQRAVRLKFDALNDLAVEKGISSKKTWENGTEDQTQKKSWYRSVNSQNRFLSLKSRAMDPSWSRVPTVVNQSVTLYSKTTI